jgi:hypothetical protein
VVFLFLNPFLNAALRPKLDASLRPGARVLSRSFELTEEFGFPVPSPGAISLESA